MKNKAKNAIIYKTDIKVTLLLGKQLIYVVYHYSRASAEGKQQSHVFCFSMNRTLHDI